MGDEQVTTMMLKVDLQCCKCYKKVKKILCQIPQIRDQIYNEKENTVTIKVVCGSPEKIMEKIRCKGGDSIKSIEIVHPPKPDNKPPKKKPNPTPPKETQDPPPSPEKPKPIPPPPGCKCCIPATCYPPPYPCCWYPPPYPCCRKCCGGVTCYCGHKPPPCVICYDGYCGRPVCDSWGSCCDKSYCRSRCTDHIC